MKKIISIILVFFLAGVCYASSDKVIAIVNNDVITKNELDSFMKVISGELTSKYKGDELDKQIQKLKSDTLERLIEERLIQQEAKKKNITVKKEEINSRITQFKREFPSDADFYASLKQQGLTIADIEKKIKDQIVSNEVISTEVRSKIKISPFEVTDFYKANQDKFKEPEKRMVDSIFSDSKDQADDILKKILTGEDFKSLEEKFSKRSSLGEVGKGQLKENLDSAIFSLEESQVSAVLGTGDGYYIFKVDKVIPPRIKELSEVQDEITNYLYDEKFQKRLEEWFAELKEKSHIVINEN